MLMARICDRFECPSSCRLPLPMDRIWRGKVDQDHVAMSQSSSHCQYARRYSSNENCQRYCGFHGPCLVLQYSAPDSFTPNECVKFTNETGVQWYWERDIETVAFHSVELMRLSSSWPFPSGLKRHLLRGIEVYRQTVSCLSFNRLSTKWCFHSSMVCSLWRYSLVKLEPIQMLLWFMGTDPSSSDG